MIGHVHGSKKAIKRSEAAGSRAAKARRVRHDRKAWRNHYRESEQPSREAPV